ncbi:MAG: hypothetical protein LKI99_04600 [Acetobacter fabarum]|jgi:hypothetical protein|nr:hypothetical protein [Acetobacter fabarum]MCI1927821.1 hypothetical protein [Acetobacter fabarum]MCI1947838.1 hypothetical protein [Acetobacter fabarum]MCI1988829.1 hypothetical protein [Acetobacter fabarum]MCI2024275.1 hypothetical protein [Acetobacter fabarum]
MSNHMDEYRAAEERKYLRGNLDTHVMKEDVSRSFNFRRQDGSSLYFFNLTWSRGKISISGDMGEIIFTHWQAMPTFEEAILWAHNAELEYLLGKTDKCHVYQAQKTAQNIIADANSEVITAINGYYDTKHIKDTETGMYKPVKILRYRGMRQELSACRNGEMERDDVEDIYVVEKIDSNHHFFCSIRGKEDPRVNWNLFDCWDKWAFIWKALDLFGLDKDFSDEEFPKILKADYRRQMREAIMTECETSESAANLCFRIGADDPDLYYDYSHNDYALAAAMRWACGKLIEAGVVTLPQQEAA